MTGPRTSPFSALANRNYRLYASGQAISQAGTWILRVAQAWLVLDLSGSPLTLGVLTALQFSPILVLSLTAGVLADRLPKRRLLVITQTGAMLVSGILGILVLSGTIQLWEVFVLAFALGCVNAFDDTAHTSFIAEMVDAGHLQSAVSLNASIQSVTRIAGPPIAGIIIATAGSGWCFLLNAVSYGGVLVALGLMDSSALRPSTRQMGRMLTQLGDGVRYSIGVPGLRVTLVLMLFVGTFGLNFNVVLPLIARFAFDAGPVGLGAMNAAQGLGAVAGSLFAASLGIPPARRLIVSAAVFGGLLVVLGAAPTLVVGIVLLVVVGAGQVYFLASAQTTLQLGARPEFRGRVLSMWSLLTAGTTPVGATFTGISTDAVGIRAAVAINGVLCIIGAVAGWAVGRRGQGSVSDPEPDQAAELSR